MPVWEEIESKVSRAELRAAVAHLMEVAPPADADPDGEWRIALVERFASVRAFVALLCETIAPVDEIWMLDNGPTHDARFADRYVVDRAGVGRGESVADEVSRG